MTYDVSVCRTPPQTVLRVPWGIRPDRLGEDLSIGLRELTRISGKAGLTVCGAPTITFHDDWPPERAIVVDLGAPVETAPNLGPDSGGEVVVTAGSLIARTSHRGGYDRLATAHQALRDWIEAGGYRQVGPPTEVYLVGPEEVTDPRRLLTEIRIPVAPSPALVARLDAPFDVVVARTREALRRQGFGVLSEIDVRAVLRDKAGEPIEDYLILGACHPRLACDALNADRRAGLLLPCNVIVRAAGAGTLVEAVDPEVLSGVLPHPDLERVAAEARRLLTDALAELSGAPR